MSGGSTTTTNKGTTATGATSQTNATDPYEPTQESIANIINAANSLASSNGYQAYTGSMVVPYSDQSQWGMDVLETNAKGAQDDFNTVYNQAVAQATGSGLDDASTLALQQMQDIASGKYLSGNPELDNMISRSTNDIVQSNKMASSAAGRYGSGGYQGVTDKAVADMSSDYRYKNYESERDKMQAAIESAFGMGQQRYTNKAGSSDLLANAYSNQQKPAETMMQVGSMYEDLATRQANDQYRIWQESQDAPWKTLEKLQSIIYPAAGLGGTSSSNQTTAATTGSTDVAKNPSTWQSALGGAVSGLSQGTWGALLGGLGGLLQGSS